MSSRVAPTDRAATVAPNIHGMDRGLSNTPLLGTAANQKPPLAQCGKGAGGRDVEEGMSGTGTTSDAQENFIPFRFADLRDKLIEDHPRFFAADGAAAASLKRFGRWINLRNQATLALQYQHMDEAYTLLDPDVDRDGPPVGGRRPDGDASVVDERQSVIDTFQSGLEGVLAVGEFERVTDMELEKAYKEDGPNGLSVSRYDPRVLDVKLYWRGKRMEPVTYNSWRTLYLPRTMELQVYQRLVMTYRLLPEAEAGYRHAQLHGPWYRRVWRCLTCQTCQSDVTKVRNNGMQLSSGYLYMKIFKDIQLADVDMLIPGATIHFTWVDWAIVLLPMLGGAAFAIYKAASGRLYFNDLVHIAASLVLILGPLLYGWTAYFNILAKEAKYAAYINQLVLHHNICNNESVLYQLLDEAQEQDDNEALLAFFFLWTMQQDSKTGLVSQWDLETRVEEYLQGLIMAHTELDNVDIDFDVSGAVYKLRMYNMLTADSCVGSTEDKGHNRMLAVKTLAEAEQLAHMRHFDESVEVAALQLGGSVLARRGLSAGMRSNAIAGAPPSPLPQPSPLAARPARTHPAAPWLKAGSATAWDAEAHSIRDTMGPLRDEAFSMRDDLGHQPQAFSMRDNTPGHEVRSAVLRVTSQQHEDTQEPSDLLIPGGVLAPPVGDAAPPARPPSASSSRHRDSQKPTAHLAPIRTAAAIPAPHHLLPKKGEAGGRSLGRGEGSGLLEGTAPAAVLALPAPLHRGGDAPPPLSRSPLEHSTTAEQRVIGAEASGEGVGAAASKKGAAGAEEVVAAAAAVAAAAGKAAAAAAADKGGGAALPALHVPS